MSKFKLCKICGKTIELMNQEIIPTFCCGEEMELLNPNTVDASHEKHVPVYTIQNDEIIVQIGEDLHPSVPEHHIMWIALVAENIIEKKLLQPGDKPEARFRYFENSEIYAYCDIHGLWKKEVK